MRTAKSRRIAATSLLLLFVADISFPTVSLALTGGPSQPELQSFEPMGTNQMVDLFSGDFTYNIPLMNVPGPNGGYPINLHYHAAPNMEEEASWVGLGWNINVGAINRSVRGVPDDFSGEHIKRTRFQKKHVSAVFNYTGGSIFSNLPQDSEFFGFEDIVPSSKGMLSYDTYQGFAFRTNLGLSKAIACKLAPEAFESVMDQIEAFKDNKIKSKKDGFLEKISDKIPRLFPKFSPKSAEDKMTWDVNGSPTALSQAIQKMSLKSVKQFASGLNSGPSVSNPTQEKSVVGFELSLWNDGALAWDPADVTLHGAVTTREITSSNQSLPAFGALYHNESDLNAPGVLDFGLEAVAPISKRSPVIPMPVQHQDVYSMTGQGNSGSFRLASDDFRIFAPGKESSEHGGTEVGIEWGDGITSALDGVPQTSIGNLKMGADILDHSGEDYKGAWRDGDNPLLSFQPNGGAYDVNLEREPRFVSGADRWAERTDRHAVHDGDNPVAFRVNISGDKSTLGGDVFPSKKAEVYNEVVNSSLASVSQPAAVRDRASTAIHHVTFEEYDQRSDLYPEFVYDEIPGEGQVAMDGSLAGTKQIAQIQVTNANGMIYHYGIPAMSGHNGNASMRISGELDPTGLGSNPMTLTPAQLSEVGAEHLTGGPGGNAGGFDKDYTHEETPIHAHSYMLTAVFSQDYVDVNGNGPDEADMGYYCLFNYEQVEDYPWRAPYEGASYVKGSLSWQDDDVVSVGYGVKDMFFIESIETKTHKAVFHMDTDIDGDGVPDPREDALSALLPNDGVVDDEYLDDLRDGDLTGSNHAGARRLDRIELFKKGTNGQQDYLVQTVHFQYDYSLCKGVPNHLNPGPLSGKLTLNKLWFTNGENQAGSLSPYVFDYEGDEDPLVANPNYQAGASDRWGSYADLVAHPNLKTNPYVRQNTPDRDRDCAAWSLRRITMPSGGEIHLEYESDDYQYVQDRRAMEMTAFKHTARISNGEVVELSDVGNPKAKIKGGWNGVAFEMEPGTDIEDYMQGIDFLYFKVWMKLKGSPDGDGKVYDYVTGWAEVEDYGTHCLGEGDGDCLGFIQFKDIPYGTLGALKANPMRKAGWELLQGRSDLFPGNPDGEASASEVILDAFGGIMANLTSIFGFYVKANAAGWCNHLKLDANSLTSWSAAPASFVRLNSPRGAKEGGDYRIREITLRENGWDEGTYGQTTSSYGQRYSYQLDDGTSSGVAQNEPSAGGDENALKQIDGFYNSSSNQVSLDSADDFIVEPIGENYLPGPGVGYSKVTVTPIGDQGPLPGGNPDDVNAAITASGIQINEFYTAKDFPVRTRRTSISKVEGTLVNRFVPIFIPTVGKQLFQAQGYSQGFAVYLNDMHGKPKSVATVPYFFDGIQASSRTEYHYHVDPNNASRISSEVDVLTEFGVERQNVGKTMEFFGYMEESDTWDNSMGVAAGLEYQTPVIFIPSLQVPCDYTRSNIRTVSTTKVVRQKGIMERVDHYVDGSFSSIRNKVYDKLGGVVLSETDNAWGNPVFTRNYPAHSEYEGLSAASSNLGFVIPGTSPLNDGGISGSDMPAGEDVQQFFYPGDQVFVYSTTGAFDGVTGWVHRIAGFGGGLDDHAFEVRDINGDVVSMAQPHSLRIVRSGRRNLLGMPAGTIVALSNPLGSGVNDIFATVASGLETVTNWADAAGLSFDMTCECSDDQSFQLTELGLYGGGWGLRLSGTSLSEFWANFDQDLSGLVWSGEPVSMFINEDAQLFELHIGGEVYYTSHYGFKHGIPVPCKPCRVLHASATTYSDDWQLNYAEAGLDDPELLADGDPFAFGREGIWRNHQSFAYQVDRLQSEENTRNWMDGEFATFDAFNWNTQDPIGDNPNWTLSSEVTAYSPYGFALESKDALGNYSAQMFGYDQSFVTASVGNARLHEIAFDSFEDYGGAYSGGGHWFLTGGVSITDAFAHAGRHALEVSSTAAYVTGNVEQDNYPFFFPEVVGGAYVGDYLLTAWVRGEGTISVSGTVDAPSTVDIGALTNAPIEGWHKIEIPIHFDGSGASFALYMQSGSGESLFLDDLRIAPADAGIETYVYNPETFFVEAILDDNHYATFFDYSPDGKLVQRRIETERGVQTVMMATGATKRTAQ